MLAVETRGLTKRYGDRAAVDELDLRLRRGAVTGFVGPNGAGKTTTIRMLLGLVRPTTGKGTVLGEPLTHPERYLGRVGALIEAPAFYPALSGRDNLRALARLGGLEPGRIGEALERVGLSGRATDPVRSYSHGMKQRLGVAAALLPDPQLLILDEPTNGLDPAGIREMRGLLRRVADGGATVFVSSHLLSEVEAICDDLVLIAAGRLRFQGSIRELLDGQRSVLRATPEWPEDLPRLVALVASAGLEPRVEDGEVQVRASAGWAGVINRRAMKAGITLVGLAAQRPSLEEAFFAATVDRGQRQAEEGPVS
jgi:ABC-2 type transport system ATP-binding protein